MHLQAATTPAHFDAMAQVLREYLAWLRQRYGADAWFVTEVLDKQDWDTELSQLATAYGPPKGQAFLLMRAGSVCGCGAFKRLSPQVCEMKRVFVPTRHQGAGLGRLLCQGLVDAARANGFERMVLDSALRLTEAHALYQSLGFEPCEPYLDYPPELLAHLRFMSIKL